jgi:hypothetical protein
MAPIPPRPGSTPSSVAVQEREDRRRRIAVATLGADEYRLHLSDVGPEDNRICRKQTGLPFWAYFEDFGLDSLLVIVWMAQRKAGDRNLHYGKVEADYPTNESIAEAGWTLDIVDEDTIDVEVVGEDPLPSAGA